VALGKRIFTEALGTGVLVCTVVGSGIMAERLAGGNQVIALLGNTIPTGAILVVLITKLGPVSGAHFNPAVTDVMAALGKFTRSEIVPYLLAQCGGGIAGTVLALLMFDLRPRDDFLKLCLLRLTSRGMACGAYRMPPRMHKSNENVAQRRAAGKPKLISRIQSVEPQ
jgi:hypothetical protein